MSYPPKRIGSLRASFIFTFFFVLAGCGKERLVSDLAEKEAVELALYLQDEGVVASSVASAQGAARKVSIDVPRADYYRAVSAMLRLGYPKASEQTRLAEKNIEAPLSRDGMLMRLDSSYGREIEAMVRMLPEVAEVRVFVYYKAAKPHGDAAKVVLYIRPIYTGNGFEVINQQKVRTMVARLLPLTQESEVEVSLVQPALKKYVGEQGSATCTDKLVELKPFNFQVRATDVHIALNNMLIVMLVTVVGGAILGFIVGIILVNRRWRNRFRKLELT